MSSASQVDKQPIASKQQLVEWFQEGCTPNEKRLIGVEHEKPPFYLADGKPVSFLGEDGRAGIQDFLAKMVSEKGWQAGEPERGIVVDLKKNQAGWTFEPALQMEVGGAPLRNVHQNAQETDQTIREAVEVSKSLGFGMLAAGFHPTHLSKDLPMMPKSRYEALFEWFEKKKFPNANDVASCTSTVQVNMGYQSEEDMVKMLRVSLSLQPIAVSLFANSPFAEGQPTGYQSYRSHKLHNNMGGRYGFMLPIAFEEGFGFEMFTDYAMKTMPMIGIYKGNVFMDANGGKFSDFMEGKLDIVPGQKAAIGDWQNHLNTIWPEVRLRKFLEMRGTDNGPQEMIKALPAFWVGLLYDKQALDQAYNMVKDWSNEDRDYLRIMTPKDGLQTKFMGTTVQEIAKDCLKLSEAGLKRRGVLNEKGQDESMYLEPLNEIADSGRNWAVRLLEAYNGEWNRDINQIFKAMNYENNPSVLKFGNGLEQTATAANKRIIVPGDKDFKMGRG
ncbi:MAG: glutamate-cysteine ligase family protein [Micavibrio sp.]|nr:glutamate-cysteine ligase family protein [Micavibrio sp.]